MSVSGIGKSPSKVYAGDTSIMRLTLHKTLLIQLKFEACENIFLIKVVLCSFSRCPLYPFLSCSCLPLYSGWSYMELEWSVLCMALSLVVKWHCVGFTLVRVILACIRKRDRYLVNGCVTEFWSRCWLHSIILFIHTGV